MHVPVFCVLCCSFRRKWMLIDWFKLQFKPHYVKNVVSILLLTYLIMILFIKQWNFFFVFCNLSGLHLVAEKYLSFIECWYHTVFIRILFHFSGPFYSSQRPITWWYTVDFIQTGTSRWWISQQCAVHIVICPNHILLFHWMWSN